MKWNSLGCFLLLLAVEKPQRISGRRQMQTWDRCQHQCCAAQRRPNTANYNTNLCLVLKSKNSNEGLKEGLTVQRRGELNLGMFISQLGEHFEFMEQRRVGLFFCAGSSDSLWPGSFQVPSLGWYKPVTTYNSDSNYKKVVNPRGLCLSLTYTTYKYIYIWVREFARSLLWLPLSF